VSPAADNGGKLLRFGFYVALAVCSYFAFAPSPPELPVFRLGDIALHAFAFSFLTFALLVAFRDTPALRAAVWMFAYGLLIEAVQSFETERSAELKDLLVDLAGIGVGLFVAHFGAARVRSLVVSLVERI